MEVVMDRFTSSTNPQGLEGLNDPVLIQGEYSKKLGDNGWVQEVKFSIPLVQDINTPVQKGSENLKKAIELVNSEDAIKKKIAVLENEIKFLEVQLLRIRLAQDLLQKLCEV